MPLTSSFEQLKKRAKENRKKQTDEERILWKCMLGNYVPRFHRQYIIDPYIVDFYCPKLKLIVEVDGCQHYTDEMLKYDGERTKYIEDKGYKILRVTNGDIMHDYENTLFYIDAVCRERADELGIKIEFKLKKE